MASVLDLCRLANEPNASETYRTCLHRAFAAMVDGDAAAVADALVDALQYKLGKVMNDAGMPAQAAADLFDRAGDEDDAELDEAKRKVRIRRPYFRPRSGEATVVMPGGSE